MEMLKLHVAGFLHPADILILPSHIGLKVADCTVQSAEYWCFYGTWGKISEIIFFL